MMAPSTTKQHTDEDSFQVTQTLGPDSLFWRFFGDYRYHLFLPQAFVMQVSHPIIDAGVSDFSTFQSDPWGRAKRSVKLLWPIVYSRPEKALDMSKQLWDLHKKIKGVDKQGKKYYSLDPEAYGWVHTTGLYTAFACWPHIVGTPPLTNELRQQLFSEWRQLGLLMGLRDQHLPTTLEDYWRGFYQMIETRLQRGDTQPILLDKHYFYHQPKPPAAIFTMVPDSIWRQMIKPAAWSLELIMRGTLPPEFRRKFNIPWSRRDARRLKLLFAGMRLAGRLTPERLLTTPIAWRAKQDARRHPDAFIRKESH